MLEEVSARKPVTTLLGRSWGWRQPKQGGKIKITIKDQDQEDVLEGGGDPSRGVKTRKPVRTLVNIDDFEGTTR